MEFPNSGGAVVTQMSANSNYVPLKVSSGTAQFDVTWGGLVGVGTLSPSTTLQVAGASSTIRIGAGSIAGCLEIMDSSGNGTINYITASGGVLSATTTKPNNCQ
jgi:hypothetical protein